MSLCASFFNFLNPSQLRLKEKQIVPICKGKVSYYKNNWKNNWTHSKVALGKTSWANTRVKIHYNVHSKLNKILGPKKLRPRRFWVKKSFGSTKIVGPKKLGQKKVWVKYI